MHLLSCGNLCDARHLNVAHGIYPRVPVSARLLDALALWLQHNVRVDAGRTYAGGLTKFDLAAPPISEDDLKTLAETSLSPAALAGDAAQARRVRDTVLHVLDPHRFPWIGEGRAARDYEHDRAVVASAALVAARKVETFRRSKAKGTQESAVKDKLQEIGLREVSPRDIALLDAAPDVGEFCGESRLGGTRADLVVRLYDGRALPIECKVSNSAVNSFKRVNHEAVGKAGAWLAGFGNRQVVPMSVISGVFNPANLETAQSDGLYMVWGHRLDDLADFVLPTRSG